MKQPTFWDKIKEPFESIYNKIEYYFAKKWLDETLGRYFGKQEYWGDFLLEKFYPPKE